MTMKPELGRTAGEMSLNKFEKYRVVGGYIMSFAGYHANSIHKNKSESSFKVLPSRGPEQFRELLEGPKRG